MLSAWMGINKVLNCVLGVLVCDGYAIVSKAHVGVLGMVTALSKMPTNSFLRTKLIKNYT